MRGEDLRALVEASGLKMNAFQERVATAVVGDVHTAADEKRRQNALRTVKRWFRKEGSHEVRPQQHYRDAVRVVLGSDPWDRPSTESRLLALEDEMKRCRSSLERVLETLARANIALPADEAAPRSDATAPRDRPHEGNGH